VTARLPASQREGAGLSVAELYDHPPLMRLWPTFGRDVCQLAEATTYQLASEGRLPVEVVRLGRRRYVRTSDVLAWLHLSPNDDGAEVAPPTPPVENDPIHTQR
jgi:hypothetical protein